MTALNQSPLPLGEGQGEGSNLPASTVLTQNLPLLAGAPNGIKKLRELILELAVRGKLVPQDTSDEPARELLKRIAEEKARLVAEGKLKKQKALAEITEEEKPFGLPEGWCWASLNEIAAMRGGSTPSMSKSEFWGGDIPWVSPKDMHDGDITDSELKVTQLALDKTSLELVPIGSILLVGRSGILKRKLPAQITAVPCTINQDLKAISPFQPQPSDYVQLMLRGTERVILKEDVKQGTTVQSLVYDKLFVRPFGLPPLAEQHRIVAKVDELMALCDRLEAQQADAESAHTQLLQALLNSLIQASDATDFSTNWQRLAEHFHTLFTTEPSIDALKQTLLQLAVMGKLVPQDPSDEPAGEDLVKELAHQRNEVRRSGRIRESKEAIDFSGLDEMKICIPPNWNWVRMSEIAEVVRGGSPRPAGDPQFYGGDIPFLKVADITAIKGKYLEGYSSTIKEAGLKKTRYIDAQTVLLTNSGATLGVPGICNFPASFNDGVAAFIEKSDLVFDEYLYLYLKTLTKWFLTIASRGQGQPNLNTDIIKSTWFALPPLAEQHRIVAKVDQLMALCDQLKTRLTQARQLNEQLACTLVEQAVA